MPINLSTYSKNLRTPWVNKVVVMCVDVMCVIVMCVVVICV